MARGLSSEQFVVLEMLAGVKQQPLSASQLSSFLHSERVRLFNPDFHRLAERFPEVLKNGHAERRRSMKRTLKRMEIRGLVSLRQVHGKVYAELNPAGLKALEDSIGTPGGANNQP